MISGIVGTDPALKYTVAPTGGVIVLEPASQSDFSSWTLTRFLSVSGVNVSGAVLIQGVAGQSPTQVFVDIGEGTNLPLDPANLYVYQLTTAAGTVDTPALSPACSIQIEQDSVNQILFRALQSGISALRLPAGFKNGPRVMHAMPLSGAGVPALPAITFNETLLQQQDIPIGQDINTDWQSNEFQIATQSVRHFTVFVMAANVMEREYYKDAVIAIFSSILGPVLEKIGNNVNHRFQVSSSQIIDRNTEPGFYFAEILLEFTGLYSVGIKTSYGIIEHIAVYTNETDEIYLSV
jgi:hypothetical protein